MKPWLFACVALMLLTAVSPTLADDGGLARVHIQGGHFYAGDTRLRSRCVSAWSPAAAYGRRSCRRPSCCASARSLPGPWKRVRAKAARHKQHVPSEVPIFALTSPLVTDRIPSGLI